MEVLETSAYLDEAEERRTHQRHAKIATLAYFLWCCGGRRIGYAEVDWCISEHMIETASFRTGATVDPINTLTSRNVCRP